MENKTRERTIKLINKYGVAPQAKFSQNFLVDDLKIDEMVERVTNAIKEYDDPIKITTNVTNDVSEWFLLKDE